MCGPPRDVNPQTRTIHCFAKRVSGLIITFLSVLFSEKPCKHIAWCVRAGFYLFFVFFCFVVLHICVFAVLFFGHFEKETSLYC